MHCVLAVDLLNQSPLCDTECQTDINLRSAADLLTLDSENMNFQSLNNREKFKNLHIYLKELYEVCSVTDILYCKNEEIVFSAHSDYKEVYPRTHRIIPPAVQMIRLFYLDFLCLSALLLLPLRPVQKLLPEQRRLVVLRKPTEQSPAGTPLPLSKRHTDMTIITPKYSYARLQHHRTSTRGLQIPNK